jgi:opacity protein-like surface antigen
MFDTTLKLITVFLFVLGFSVLQAQETVPASGGNAAGSGGTAGYTIGQIAYSALTGNSGTVTQGVQQPIEITVVTGLEEAAGISLEFTVYPNPTSDILKLLVANHKTENLIYQLYDIHGSLLQKNEITGSETILRIGNLVPASYFLKISDTHNELKTFKIIKTK